MKEPALAGVLAVLCCSILAETATAAAPSAQTPAAGWVDSEWRYHGGDPGARRYTPLSQITTDNAAELEIVWR